MSFLYPLGLLGLLGIPVIIAIYILKSKYTEQVISSTFLWNLSNKFLGKKKPISKFAGIISLILQLLTVIVASLLIAHPVITLSNAARDYCFILDGSGSMNMTLNENETLFSKGQKEIEDIIESSVNGSTYTLVLSKDDVSTIYEGISDKENAISLLNELDTSDTNPSSSLALKYAQEYFNQNNAKQIYFVTCRDYEVNNVTLINVYSDVINYSISDTNYEIKSNELEVNATLNTNYSSTIQVSFYVDNALISSQNVEMNKEEEKEITFTYSNTDFNEIKVQINNEDALIEDNTNIIYNIVKEHNRSVLIVSSRPFYLESALKVNKTASITTVAPEDYNENTSGYGLYIFDSYSPSSFPSDGSIWLFNISSNTSKLGFSYQDEATLSEATKLEYANDHSTTYKQLTTSLLGNDIYVSKYLKYGVYRNYTTILECDGYPVVFAGINEFNNRQITFAFDLHDSNLPLLIDYNLLCDNFIEYSFPTILEKAFYEAGDTVSINVISSCKSIKVITPSKKEKYISISGDISTYTLSESGTYTFVVSLGESEKIFNVYSSVPVNVSLNQDDFAKFIVNGQASDEYPDGIYNSLLIILIILLVALVADWGVYCYEQYQLR